ncbi:MurR/RpiR family transcriptional regulator [Glaciimonas sp. CA11.2]|nr:MULTISPECIES: MurR/RpiR family transcriptional regulator [unclassified Glaciimonas]MDY7547588.1 MurR/RpiR family transcriptional regulator [Glaciimonas sp. CA11.2]MEB0014251.1 MurR/RpiR family transcriptional regulator [Glaciimonas sp. Cout2]MEB0084013.1 MurR/RpiR family transcriptional regulator [Glaciimonas sp. Gout2]MEB0163652.1 MurR/RpiR family transcriptional regulator [Glaciimonas sp. CA11.2]
MARAIANTVTETFDIVSRISERSGHLRLAEQKVAQTILADLPFAAAASIGTLATLAGVSQASVTRFARAIGCRDVRDMKMKLGQATAIGERFLRAELPAPEGRVPQIADIIYADIGKVLEVNRTLLNQDALQHAARLLLDARMIYAFGMGGGSTMLSDEARYRLVRLGRPAATYHDALLQRMVAATLDKNDVVLVFSTTGNVPELLASCRVAKEYGVRLVAITALGSQLAKIADVLLPLKSLETDFIFKPSSSRYAMMMVLDVLMAELALLQKDHSQELLRRLKFTLDTHLGSGNREPLGD